jgi:glycosyltransferase involved in cell wall biosynthesis
MKILILDNYYEDFLESFYSKNPKVSEMDFEAHRALLLEQHFGTSDIYSYNIKKLGHEAQEIITNDFRLQIKWAQENGIQTLPLPRYLTYGLKYVLGYDWRYRIIKAQVEQIKPDVLYIQEGNILSDSFIAKLKPYVKLVVGQIASARRFNRTYHNYDLLISSFPHFVEYFKNKGLNAVWQPLAFDERMLNIFSQNKSTYPITFIGGFSPKTYKWSTPLFEDVAKQINIDVWGYGIKSLSFNSMFRKYYHGEAWGLDLYRILSESLITLNRHGEVSQQYANNMRLYEATGMGTCLITDWKENLHTIFEPDEEVVTYRSADELIEKVNYLLENDGERMKIAEAGQNRTLKDHTYQIRVKELLEILDDYI